MSILALNDSVLGQNRLKMEFSNLSELQEGSFKTGLGIYYLDWIITYTLL